MVTVLQGTHVHVVPLVKLTEPEGLLLGFGVRVQDDAHPQGPCRDAQPEILGLVPNQFHRYEFQHGGQRCQTVPTIAKKGFIYSPECCDSDGLRQGGDSRLSNN